MTAGGSTIQAGTEHGAPLPDPGPGKVRPKNNRPRRAVLDCQPFPVKTARGPVLVIPVCEFAAVFGAALFLAAIEQASRAANRTASPTTLCP